MNRVNRSVEMVVHQLLHIERADERVVYQLQAEAECG